MKPKDRDLLLGKLEESVNNIWRVVYEKDDSIDKKLDKLNGAVLNHSIRIGILWSERKRTFGIIGMGVVALILKLIGIY